MQPKLYKRGTLSFPGFSNLKDHSTSITTSTSILLWHKRENFQWTIEQWYSPFLELFLHFWKEPKMISCNSVLVINPTVLCNHTSFSLPSANEGNVFNRTPCDHYPWCIGPHCTGIPSPQDMGPHCTRTPPGALYGYGTSLYRAPPASDIWW